MKGVHDCFDWKCTILRIFGTKNVSLVTCCEPVVESSSTKACTQVRGWNGFPAILAAKGWYEVYMRNLMSTGMKHASKESTLDLKHKEDFIKSSKYSYQWLYKKDSNVLQISHIKLQAPWWGLISDAQNVEFVCKLIHKFCHVIFQSF